MSGMKPITHHCWSFVFALGLVACAGAPQREVAPQVAVPTTSSGSGLSVNLSEPVVPLNDPRVWGASVSGQELFGLIRVQSSYDLLRAELAPAAGAQRAEPYTGVLGSQRLTQQVSTALPLPLMADLELQWGSEDQLSFNSTGMISQRRDTRRLRWAPAGYELDVASIDAPTATVGAEPNCSVDARLQRLRPLSALGHSRLSLSGRRCQRLAGEEVFGADIYSLSADWDSKQALGIPGLASISLSGTAPQAEAQRVEPVAGGFEVGLDHALALGDWTLSSRVAASPNAGSAESGRAWASRASLSRTLWHTPVTASWTRQDQALWTLGAAQQTGTEAALGVDLSPQLRSLLGPGLGANLSYRHLRYDSGELADDQQLQMGVQLDW